MSEIQNLPAQAIRVETGAVRFGEDLPGLFIRGDEACSLMLSIRKLTKAPPFSMRDHMLSRLELESLADTIEATVIQK
jgi:hypothetical protein